MINSLRDSQVISILGNTKNAGKTTVLNALVKESQSNVLLTSIGLDGEDLDQVTHLEKPQVFVRKNDYVLTAKDTLAAFSAPYKIVKTYPIQSSIGQIVLCQILHAGQVLIAGPSRVEDMKDVIEDIERSYNLKIIIDGAFFRQSYAHIGDGVIFVIGANYSRDMNLTLEHAELNYWKLNLRLLKDCDYYHLLKDHILTIKNNQVIDLGYPSVLGHIDDILKQTKDIDALYIPKALTDGFIEAWTKDYKNHSFNLILQSGIHLQLKNHNMKRLKQLAQSIDVKEAIHVLAVCMNPTSPSGYTYPKDIFRAELENRLNVSVFDVKEDKIYE